MLPQSTIKLLLIEDEDFDVRRVRNTIKLFQNRIEIVNVFSNGSDAVEHLQSNSTQYDVIVMDYQIAGATRGEVLIKKIKEINPTLQIIVITKLTINITDYEFANSLVKAGAYWYCTKYPGDIEEYIYQPTDFILSIFNAYETKKLQQLSNRSNRKLQQSIDEILDRKKIISVSGEMAKLKEKIDKLAGSDISTVITGASGTGKELVAHNIHYRSKRKFENFVPINCGSIPSELIESELFGYEKGAFTGATAGKAGLFEVANNGTIFLDEIAELPQHAQVKLLRVIQEGEVEKIGRTKSINIDVRIIAATNKDLEKEIDEGRFREDLYYRLNVVPIFITPLTQRKDDIPVLIEHFMNQYSIDMKMKKPKIEEDAMRLLIDYEWPGNVRELKNVTQRLLFNASDTISIDDVEDSLIMRRKNKTAGEIFNFTNPAKIEVLKKMEADFRRRYFTFVREHSSSDAEAASKLGLAPPNFYRMCKELGLK